MDLKQIFGVSALAIVSWQIIIQPKSFYGQVKYKGFNFRFDTLTFALESTRGAVLMGRSHAMFKWHEHKPLNFGACSEGVAPSENGSWDEYTCVEWEGIARLEVASEAKIADDNCFTMRWTSLSSEFTPMDCITLAGSHWYGGSELVEQRWPSSLQSVDMKPFLAGDLLQNRSENVYGSVLGRMWISSSGVGVNIRNNVPLHVSFNESGNKLLCLKADYTTDGGLYPQGQGQLPVLHYTMCRTPNVVSAYHSIMKRYYKLPKGIPDKRMLTSPVWSTWAEYKMNVNLSSVVQYAANVLKHGFNNSQLEIDDKWATAYGDMVFDERKFPSPKDMVGKLAEQGFRTTVWVTPFFNLESKAFHEAARAGFLVKDVKGIVPGLVKWWQGIGGVLDVTNPAAAEWYKSNLRQLQKDTGVDSFKFDAGEVYHYLPRYCKTHETLRNPSDFTALYAQLVADMGSMVEMRSAYNSQEQPIFVRMMDKDSVWGYENGLKTMIPTALLMSILGYHFNLPDMIGGNGYPEEATEGLQRTILPDKELFIRWVQLSAYLPSMQFSIAPWRYDNEVVNISRKMVTIHETLVAPLVISAAEEATEKGVPIIRPLWWHDPHDETALTTDSEFLVGRNLLVAPVLEKDARSRNIYLPEGKWRDNLRGKVHAGRSWLTSYKASLQEVPTFSRLD